ncbi:MAG TPA: DUF4352 domain-containing protein [Dehalococcoidia bacterium]
MGKLLGGMAIGCGGLVGLLLIIVIIAVAASGDGSPGATEGDRSTEAPAAQPAGEGTPAGQAATAPRENEAALAPGQSATAEGLRITLVEVVDPYISRNQFSRPAPGYRYVAFRVLFENVSDRNQFVSAFDFTLIDTESFQYDPTSVVFDGPALYECPSQLTGGGRCEGWVGFQVREGVGLKDLMYDPNTFTRTDHHFRAP